MERALKRNRHTGTGKRRKTIFISKGRIFSMR